MLVTMNEILPEAKKGHYAVGLFNAVTMELAQGIIAAAEETGSPVIFGTAEVLLPHGELQLIAPSIIHAAKNAKVPVVVHYDHGLTFEKCMEALKLGFSSIMFDGSAGDYSKNINEQKILYETRIIFESSV
jgi:fructose-bisphosphate aldolase class II